MITTDTTPVSALQAAFAHVQQEHLVTAADFPVVWCNAPESEVLKAYTVDNGKMFLTEAEFQEIMANSANNKNVVNIFSTPVRQDLTVDLYRNKDVNKVDLSNSKYMVRGDLDSIPVDEVVDKDAKLRYVLSAADIWPESEIPVEVAPAPIETEMGLSTPRTYMQSIAEIKPLDEPIIWNQTDGIIEYLHIFKNLPTKELDKECASPCFRSMMVALKRNLWFNEGINVELARRLRKEGFTVNYVTYRNELTVIVHPDGPFVWKV
jgi:hypothetical protein